MILDDQQFEDFIDQMQFIEEIPNLTDNDADVIWPPEE